MVRDDGGSSRSEDAPADAPMVRDDGPLPSEDASDAPWDAPSGSDAILDVPAGDLPDQAGSDAGTPGSDAAAASTGCRICPVGQTWCNSRCVSPTDPVLGCGTVCFPCSPPNANARCEADGRCLFESCWPGWADCNNDLKDGCETDLTDFANCGACGVKCTGVCAPKGCADSCPADLYTCRGRCVDITNWTTVCTGCVRCPTAVNGVAPPTCTAGVCSPPACHEGWTLCGLDYFATFTCVDTRNDPNNCGGCGAVCQGKRGTLLLGTCVQGKCASICAPGATMCGDECARLDSNSAHCGACGHACSADEVCIDGACRPEVEQRFVSNVTPWHIVVNGGELFFSSPGGIYKLPVAGGPVVQVTSMTGALAVDATHVYLGQRNEIKRVPRDGSGPPEEVVAKTANLFNLAVGTDLVYWAEEPLSDGSYAIRSAPKAGGAPTTLADAAYLRQWWLLPPFDFTAVGADFFVLTRGLPGFDGWGGGHVMHWGPGPSVADGMNGLLTYAFAVDQEHQFWVRASPASSPTYSWGSRTPGGGPGAFGVSPVVNGPLLATPCGAAFGGNRVGFIPLIPTVRYEVTKYAVTTVEVSKRPTSALAYAGRYIYWIANDSIYRARVPWTW
jgi:hypothetical protein